MSPVSRSWHREILLLGCCIVDTDPSRMTFFSVPSHPFGTFGLDSGRQLRGSEVLSLDEVKVLVSTPREMAGLGAPNKVESKNPPKERKKKHSKQKTIVTSTKGPRLGKE